MVENLEDILHKEEKLHPELKARLYKRKAFRMIGHKLVHEVMYTPQLNAFYNCQFAAKKEQLEKALEAKNWTSYVWIHERPYRLEAFCEIEFKVYDREYWGLLHDIWLDSENIWQYLPYWERFLRSGRPEKEYFMDAEDKKFYKSLPKELTIWRGHQKHNKDGLSYTLSKEKAEWFAGRFKKEEAKVKELQIKKSQIFACIVGRGESEVIILE